VHRSESGADFAQAIHALHAPVCWHANLPDYSALNWAASQVGRVSEFSFLLPTVEARKPNNQSWLPASEEKPGSNLHSQGNSIIVEMLMPLACDFRPRNRSATEGTKWGAKFAPHSLSLGRTAFN